MSAIGSLAHCVDIECNKESERPTRLMWKGVKYVVLMLNSMLYECQMWEAYQMDMQGDSRMKQNTTHKPEGGDMKS